MGGTMTRRRTLAAAAALAGTAALSGCGVAGVPAGLYIVDRDGAPRWIADTTGAPAWSPDGSALAWCDEQGLHVWHESSAEITTVADVVAIGRPSWSPDGASLAYLDPRARLLQRFDLDSNVVTPLALLYEGTDSAIRPPMVVRGGPAWSPDARQIAFVCWDGYGDELCLVDAEGNTRQQLTTLGVNAPAQGNLAPSSVTSLAWSPDGKAIAAAVQAEQRGATAGIFLIDVGARIARRLSGMTCNAPIVWASASDSLVYSATVEGRSDVYRMPSAGGTPEALTTSLPDGAREPAVSDSDGLAAVSGEAVAMLQAAPGPPQFVAVEGLSPSSPAWQPQKEAVVFLALPRPIRGYP